MPQKIDFIAKGLKSFDINRDSCLACDRKDDLQTDHPDNDNVESSGILCVVLNVYCKCNHRELSGDHQNGTCIKKPIPGMLPLKRIFYQVLPNGVKGGIG